MTKTFSAIFENGVFRPVEPVDLPEYCRVQVDVRTVRPVATDAGQAIAPQRVRLVGRLVAVHQDTRTFDLVLDDGQRVAAEWISGDMAVVMGLIDQRVLLLATATCGPAGDLLRVDAEEVGLATEAGDFFSAIPRTAREHFDLEEVFRAQRHKPGVSAIIGQWPGDESDEEIAAALEELS